MQITNVRVTHLTNSSTLALASITFDDVFVVSGLKVMYSSKNDNLFVSMPSRKNKDNEYKDICFPINKDLRNEITNKVLQQYHNTKPQHNERTYQGQYSNEHADLQPQKNARQQAYDNGIDVTEEMLPF